MRTATSKKKLTLYPLKFEEVTSDVLKIKRESKIARKPKAKPQKESR
jgi:hypothetical protein